MKPTALANVHQFYRLLKPEIQIIGCGGIQTGADAFEHILCGASMVQVGTELLKGGLDTFNKIKKELIEWMVLKNYNSLESFRGKLNYL